MITSIWRSGNLQRPSQYSGSSDDTVTKANAETEQRLKEVNEAYHKNKDQVIQKLLAGIVNVQPQVNLLFEYIRVLSRGNSSHYSRL